MCKSFYLFPWAQSPWNKNIISVAVETEADFSFVVVGFSSFNLKLILA